MRASTVKTVLFYFVSASASLAYFLLKKPARGDSDGVDNSQNLAPFLVKLLFKDGVDAEELKCALRGSSERLGLTIFLGINFFASLFALGSVATTAIFLNDLSTRESTRMAERLVKFAVPKLVLVKVLAPNAFEVAGWLAWFSVIGYLRLFVGAAKDRLEMLAVSPAATPSAHLRALGLLALTLLQDVAALRLMLSQLLTNRMTMTKVLFASFDAVVTSIDGTKTLIRYGIQVHSEGQSLPFPLPRFLLRLAAFASRAVAIFAHCLHAAAALARPLFVCSSSLNAPNSLSNRASAAHAPGFCIHSPEAEAEFQEAEAEFRRLGPTEGGTVLPLRHLGAGGATVLDALQFSEAEAEAEAEALPSRPREPWEGWEDDGNFLYHTELVADVLVHLLTLVHYIHVWSLHGLSFHLIDVLLFLDIRIVSVSMHSRIRSYLIYRAATRKLDTAFQSVTFLPPDCAEGSTDPVAATFAPPPQGGWTANSFVRRTSEVVECTICMDAVSLGKQLPCGHIFHLSCLRAWLQQSGTDSFNCPNCRSPILVNGQRSTNAPPWQGSNAWGGAAARGGEGGSHVASNLPPPLQPVVAMHGSAAAAAGIFTSAAPVTGNEHVNQSGNGLGGADGDYSTVFAAGGSGMAATPFVSGSGSYAAHRAAAFHAEPTGTSSVYGVSSSILPFLGENTASSSGMAAYNTTNLQNLNRSLGGACGSHNGNGGGASGRNGEASLAALERRDAAVSFAAAAAAASLAGPGHFSAGSNELLNSTGMDESTQHLHGGARWPPISLGTPGASDPAAGPETPLSMSDLMMARHRVRRRFLSATFNAAQLAQRPRPPRRFVSRVFRRFLSQAVNWLIRLARAPAIWVLNRLEQAILHAVEDLRERRAADRFLEQLLEDTEALQEELLLRDTLTRQRTPLDEYSHRQQLTVNRQLQQPQQQQQQQQREEGGIRNPGLPVEAELQPQHEGLQLSMSMPVTGFSTDRLLLLNQLPLEHPGLEPGACRSSGSRDRQSLRSLHSPAPLSPGTWNSMQLHLDSAGHVQGSPSEGTWPFAPEEGSTAPSSLEASSQSRCLVQEASADRAGAAPSGSKSIREMAVAFLSQRADSIGSARRREVGVRLPPVDGVAPPSYGNGFGSMRGVEEGTDESPDPPGFRHSSETRQNPAEDVQQRPSLPANDHRTGDSSPLAVEQAPHVGPGRGILSNFGRGCRGLARGLMAHGVLRRWWRHGRATSAPPPPPASSLVFHTVDGGFAEREVASGYASASTHREVVEPKGKHAVRAACRTACSDGSASVSLHRNSKSVQRTQALFVEPAEAEADVDGGAPVWSAAACRAICQRTTSSVSKAASSALGVLRGGRRGMPNHFPPVSSQGGSRPPPSTGTRRVSSSNAALRRQASEAVAKIKADGGFRIGDSGVAVRSFSNVRHVGCEGTSVGYIDNFFGTCTEEDRPEMVPKVVSEGGSSYLHEDRSSACRGRLPDNSSLGRSPSRSQSRFAACSDATAAGAEWYARRRGFSRNDARPLDARDRRGGERGAAFPVGAMMGAPSSFGSFRSVTFSLSHGATSSVWGGDAWDGEEVTGPCRYF